MIAVLGAGGHGQDIAAAFGGDCEFYDDDPTKGAWPIEACTLPDWVIGVNDCRQRKLIADRLSLLGRRCDTSWVHPHAIVSPSVTLGRHTHVNAGAFITRANLGEFTTVGPNATICGDVNIGNLVSIGAGAVVCEFCVIGDGATIGAGAVLPPHTIVPAGQTWVGVPGRSVDR